jgi:hypothetical protein
MSRLPSQMISFPSKVEGVMARFIMISHACSTLVMTSPILHACCLGEARVLLSAEGLECCCSTHAHIHIYKDHSCRFRA